MGWEVGVTRGKSIAKVVLECVNRTFSGVATMCIWGDKLEVDIIFSEGFFHGTGAFIVKDVENRIRTVLLEMFVARSPGFGDFQGLPVLQKLGVDGVGVVVVENEYISVSAGREYREAACMVRVGFGGIGVGVDNFGKDVVGALLLLGVDVVARILMGSGGTKIILFLIKVALHSEGRPGKMF